ncbi:LuxR C-terminal-related transcriptional regulator [Actinomadura chibensis]|uniref:Response regulator transcription factor n=1 Tax=Actinomadura chibensis TaxID=392828 RepID=A0A5D0NMY9_9ACTN|nr:response regulator transcription factor [Actinomadura chibensis]TYB45361.1 response regulator transcription factor [Actinomadura chibensis]
MNGDFPMYRANGPASDAKAVRVLVVSDNPMSRIGFQALLGASPAVRVTGGGTVGRAVAGVRAHAPDVVLLDASPPPAGAIGRLARAGGRVVVVTTAQDPPLLVQAIAAGAHGCLVYGHFEPQDLPDLLVTAGRGEACLSPPVVTALVRWLHDGGGTRRHDTGLTAREAEILELIAAGLTNRQIARRLVISEKTVKNHAHQIYKRLGADGREHAAERWLELYSGPPATDRP